MVINGGSRMTDQPIYVDEEIFLGRIEEQERFREALRSLLAGRKDDDLPSVFLLYGEGGMGKTKLARRLRDIALGESKGRLRAIWLDWEKRKPLDVRLAAGDAVSPETVFEHIYAVFRDEGFGQEFDPYEKAVKSRAKAEAKVARALDERVGEGGDRYSALRELGSKGLAWLVRTGLPGGVAIPEEPMARFFESLIGGGAVGLARAREAATTLLRSKLNPDEFDLFTLPNEALARRLADGIRAAARKKPLLLVLDTYEIAHRADPWLRVVIKRAGPRVVWAIAGRDNLADSRKLGPTYFTGYRAEFPGHRLRVFPLAEFSLGDVADYFAWRVPGRPLDEESVAAIHRATLGIPLAVKEAAAIWEKGASLADIVEGVPPHAPREQIVRAMSERFLMHCWDAPEDKARVYALALAHRPDPGLVAAMLDTEALERDLSDLERRHSFMFVETMQLHEAVAAFLCEYLLAPVRRASGEVRRAHERAVAHLRARRAQLEENQPLIEERCDSHDWTGITLDLIYHLFWLDEWEGWRELVPRFVEGLGYNFDMAHAIWQVAYQFGPWLSKDGQRRVKELGWDGSIEGLETMLADLSKLGERGWLQGEGQSEQQAILALWRGGLLRWQERYKEALAAYEQVEGGLPRQGERLKQLLVEALCGLADNLVRLHTTADVMAGHHEAIAVYWRAIELDPKAVYPHSGLGSIYRALGRHEEAIAEYQKAIDLDPQSAYLYHGLGNAYYTLGRYEEAMTEYQQAIDLDPQYFLSHNNLADVYMELGRLEEARREFEERVRLSPDDALNAHVCLGIIACHLDERTEAQQQFEQALSLWDTAWARRLQTPALLLVDKAIALLGLGRVQEALGAMQEAQCRLLPGDRLEEYTKHLELLTTAPEPPEGLDEVLTSLREVAGWRGPDFEALRAAFIGAQEGEE
jgi:tetratricopeptide (TPR) repeat protein